MGIRVRLNDPPSRHCFRAMKCRLATPGIHIYTEHLKVIDMRVLAPSTIPFRILIM